jgi:SAM-dependent methyltransferase
MLELNREDWYKEWFDEDYLALYSHRNTEEARHFVAVLWSALELQAGVSIADIPCGSGRHSLALVERGARVVGVDLSPVMLRAAQQTCSLFAAHPHFVMADLRRIPLAPQFQVVINLFTSFGYFEDEADNCAAFAGLASVLASGGVLVLDTINPLYLKSHFVAENQFSSPMGSVVERRHLDLLSNRVVKRIELCKGKKIREVFESIRLYDQQELATLTRRHGLEPIEFWGDYTGETYSDESPRLILLARKG